MTNEQLEALATFLNTLAGSRGDLVAFVNDDERRELAPIVSVVRNGSCLQFNLATAPEGAGKYRQIGCTCHFSADQRTPGASRVCSKDGAFLIVENDSCKIHGRNA